MSTTIKFSQALFSVSDKTGLLAFAEQLATHGINILATGGTARLLSEHQLALTEVADYTGFPEIMSGRVKTLHPKIHAGVLARRGIDDDTLAQHQIDPIDLVVVNLYPFTQTISKADCTIEQAIEQVDIGGPTLLRAAAKNHAFVTVIVDPDDYPKVLAEIQATGNTSLSTRRYLAYKAFAHTALYDHAIQKYFNKIIAESPQESAFPEHYELSLRKKITLRYGENPHQQAALYQDHLDHTNSLTSAKLLQGKPLSYNNLQDANAALNCVRELASDHPACAIIKHATPAGAAQATDALSAYQLALRTDPVASFGGIVAFNRIIEANTAQAITKEQFVEVLLAPDFTPGALEIFSQKPNLRLLACGKKPAASSSNNPVIHSISGGFLMQQQDTQAIGIDQLQTVSKRQPTKEELDDLLFAWRIVKHVKSNAIVYAKDQATLGIGTGQTSRVFSAEIAALKAKQMQLSLQDAVMASDAFFPFADSIELAAKEGINAIIQPGGSKRDKEVIAAADQHNMIMVLTGVRHFSH